MIIDGPDVLRTTERKGPVMLMNCYIKEKGKELRRREVTVAAIEVKLPRINISRFSSWKGLLRVMVYLMRFVGMKTNGYIEKLAPFDGEERYQTCFW